MLSIPRTFLKIYLEFSINSQYISRGDVDRVLINIPLNLYFLKNTLITSFLVVSFFLHKQDFFYFSFIGPFKVCFEIIIQL